MATVIRHSHHSSQACLISRNIIILKTALGSFSDWVVLAIGWFSEKLCDRIFTNFKLKQRHQYRQASADDLHRLGDKPWWQSYADFEPLRADPPSEKVQCAFG
ncbi:hypothetical protein WAI453_002512 [Rhynchosporium graminicola]|uniref:Uncharacterized protein n=1 Tax=Rhynchosporium graminicola TaxID=2792576 RepID=A0A1E1KVV7_9HELO|nr:uncharacterized protein RCO7_11541 [Rhynchosporium commune]